MCEPTHEIGKTNMLPYLIIMKAPLNGMIPSETMEWLSADITPKLLADAYAVVDTHVWLLMHEMNSMDAWIYEAYDGWKDVEEKIRKQICSILRREKSAHCLCGLGTHYIVKPFMERYGYQDSGGWWIKKSDD